jgi:RNA polymerase sigma-70 factor (ECF subfamily)
MTDEAALLERARSYDEEAIGELYDRYARRIYAYIYRRVSEAQLAEDLTSEVFVRVLQAIRSEQFWTRSFRAWLYRIAHNLIVDYYRKRPTAPLLPLDERLISGSVRPEAAVAEAFRTQRLQNAIGQLTEDQQQVLVLRFGEQLKSREVAEIMDKSVGAVEALQHRALVALRKVFDEA